MTTYNFLSIFAWNIYLYSGFVVIIAFYLFAMMDRRASRNQKLGKILGSLAFGWRLALTMGTGSIFGFLVARDAFYGAIMAPLFIASSLAYGLAFTVLVLGTMSYETRAELMNDDMIGKFRGLLSLFILTTLFLTLMAHLVKIYAAPTRAVEAFLLLDGGLYPLAFWLGQILLGSLAPLTLLALAPSGRKILALASVLVLLGGLAQFYVIIIGGQAYPLNIFPGFVASSSFFDGAINSYAPSLPEILLGISGISIAMLIAALAFRLLPFLPEAPAMSEGAAP
jgi:molybdopterin-containing oxidoreductase family membrane subunit